MILVNSGAFLSISSWFCELTELIFVMILYISSTGYPPKRKGLWLCASSELIHIVRKSTPRFIPKFGVNQASFDRDTVI